MLKIRAIYCGTNLTLPHLYYCFFFLKKIKRFLPVVITNIIITTVTTIIISTIKDLPQWRGSSVPRAPLSLAREHKCSPDHHYDDHDQNDHHANDYYDGDNERKCVPPLTV